MRLSRRRRSPAEVEVGSSRDEPATRRDPLRLKDARRVEHLEDRRELTASKLIGTAPAKPGRRAAEPALPEQTLDSLNARSRGSVRIGARLADQPFSDITIWVGF